MIQVRSLSALAAMSMLVAVPGAAQAKGCIRGAIAGGVAGHYAGHHGGLGMVGGCIAGRAYYKHKVQRDTAARQQAAQARPATAR